MAKTPGGLAGHINTGCSTDEGYILQSSVRSIRAISWVRRGMRTATGWLYSKKFPATFPGFSAATPQIASGQYRDEGAAVLQ